jgi:RNA polymerase sigma factor (sigma-70 family)
VVQAATRPPRGVLGLESSDPTVSDLVAAAVRGEQPAWDVLVSRYMPLVVSVAGRFRLASDDIADVAQTVWMRLVQSLRTLRTPDALAGWIITTTRRECIHLLQTQRRTFVFDPLADPPSDRAEWGQVAVDLDEAILRAERHEALLIAFAELPDHQRELLLLLLADPPMSYAEISARLGIPKGSIGPTRARALERLRDNPLIIALMREEASTEGSESPACDDTAGSMRR